MSFNISRELERRLGCVWTGKQPLSISHASKRRNMQSQFLNLAEKILDAVKARGDIRISRIKGLVIDYNVKSITLQNPTQSPLLASDNAGDPVRFVPRNVIRITDEKTVKWGYCKEFDVLVVVKHHTKGKVW